MPVAPAKHSRHPVDPDRSPGDKADPAAVPATQRARRPNRGSSSGSVRIVTRIVFGMIDNPARPTGGVKVIYQAVAALRRAGIDAGIIGDRAPPWLHAPATDAFTDRVRQGDIFVTPEVMDQAYADAVLRDPERRVIWFQNHNALRTRADLDWPRFRNVRCLTVSEYARIDLVHAGFERVSVIPPGVDLTLFRPAPVKRHRIAYMPRKWRGFAERLREVVGQQVDWHPIDGLSEPATAAALAESTIFLHLGRREGFGLPPLEAMASGCLVCGFTGEGTTEFATPDNGCWTAEGDFEGCARSLEQVLALLADRDAADARVRNGLATAERYALTVFEDRITDYFRPLLS